MSRFKQIKNKIVARLASKSPSIAQHLLAAYQPLNTKDTPWTPVKISLAKAKIALVTTAGVHHPHQTPFDMSDPDGDPSYRQIDAATIVDHYTITHDYYDHRDADRDLNVVFPATLLTKMAAAGIVGSPVATHYSFMGHINGPHISDLMENKAPEVAAKLVAARVDSVLLTPG